MAAGIAEADDHLKRTLDAVGYPRARITGRALSENGTRLEVTVEPGERCFVDEVSLVGADATTRDRASGLLTIRRGDPLRRDWVATSARAVTADLRDRGYDQASVRPVVEFDAMS